MRKVLSALFMAFFAIATWALPRAEYPRPQFERQDWVNLNGEWSYTLELVGCGWVMKVYAC